MIIDTDQIPGDFCASALKILCAIYRDGSLTFRRAAEIAGISKTSVTGLADRYERYFERKPHENDRRKLLLRLTPEGLELVEALRPGLNRRKA